MKNLDERNLAGGIIFVFAFRRKQIIACTDDDRERARKRRASHTLTIRLPRFSPASNPISAFGVFSRPLMTSS